ncbi:MAG: molybdopterin-dependent oxidoreductase [Deltaproteobacteria bacterium]
MQKRFYLMLLFSLVLSFWPQAVNASEPLRETGELKSYQGVALGSVKDFYENSIGGVRKVNPRTYRLRVDGLVNKPLSYSYPELKALPHQKRIVTIHCVEGWKVTVLWEGIPIGELIRRAGVEAKVNTVIFHGVDGYTTSLDYKILAGRNLLLADSANGITLPAQLGFPLILVAEDKWGYKWARWIERIQFTDKAGFRGYWEQRGFNHEGDITGSQLEDESR